MMQEKMQGEGQAVADAEATGNREIVLTRVFDASRELVFDAYTDPSQVGEWFGPNGFSLTIHEMEVKPGGTWRFIMHGPDGTDYTNRIVYREVVRPERLQFEHGRDMDDDPDRFQVTITFEDEGGRTRLTSRMVLPSAEQRAIKEKFGAVELGYQTLQRLADHLATR